MAFYMRQSLGTRDVAVALLTASLALVAAAFALGPAAIVLPVASALGGFAVAELARSRIGGLTGDVYGAIIELGESAALVALVLIGA